MTGLGPSASVILASADERLAHRCIRSVASSDLAVAARVLDARGLGAEAPRPGTVALVDARLPGLEGTLLVRLEQAGVGVVALGLLTDPRLVGVREILPPEADAALLAEAIRRAASRSARGATRPGPRSPRAAARGVVIAVTSGHGGPGKTTLAVSLAAALAARGRDRDRDRDRDHRVVLVDLDLRGGNVGVALGLRPEFNLFQVASALAAGHDFGTAVAAELQEMRPRLDVLGGIAVPARMLVDITPSLVEQVLLNLANTHARAVADLGSESELAGPAGAGHLAALGAADLVLAVAEPSPLGLWNLRLALADGGPLAPFGSRAAIVLNRYQGRHHHAPAEVAATFPEVPVLGCIPHVDACAGAALREQRPLVEDHHSDAYKPLRALADGLAAAVREAPTEVKDVARPALEAVA